MTIDLEHDRLREVAASETSFGARLVHTVTLLLSLTVAGAVLSLWTTEPALPPRTHAAFAGIVVIACVWTALTAWSLATRRPLFAKQRVLVAWLTLVFSVLLVGGTVTAVATGAGGRAGLVGTGLATTMLVGAAWYLVRARRRLDTLARRREALERELGGGA